MTNDVDIFLEHHGVKGMKWGQRRAAKITKAAIKRHEDARDGKGLIGALAKADKVTWGGNGRHEEYQNKSINQLTDRLESIERGEKIMRTLLVGPYKTNAERIAERVKKK